MQQFVASLSALALIASGGLAFAQDAQTPPTEVEGVTITGGRLEEVVRSFVAEVAAAPRDRNLARWDRRICIGVVNMDARYAQALVDQVSAVSLAVGLDIGEPGCRANVLILADSNGDALATRLVDDSPLVFRPDLGGTNLGRAALAHFQSSGAPVRWWHVTRTVSSDTGEIAQGGATIQVRGASRLRRNVREDMDHVIIILDTSRIGALNFASLADYVAMVALAQVDAEADTAEFPTILNLFSTTPVDPGARMTQWDLDYLRALYDMDGDATNPDRQQREIARELTDSQEEDAQRDIPAED